MNGDFAPRRVLIVGGTGFIGSNLARFLGGRGGELKVYHRSDSDLANLKGVDFKSELGDLADKDTIEDTLFRAMDGCGAVYNLATCPSPLKRYHRLRELINIDAAKAIAGAARRIGGVRLIHVSSSSAVGYPHHDEVADEDFAFNAHNDHAALTKYLGEKAVLEEAARGLDAVIAIPCSTVGPHGMKANQRSVFDNISHGKMRIYPPGGLCLTYIDDLVQGLDLCREKGAPGKRYILGGSNITYKEYFDEIAYATGGKAPGLRLPKSILPALGLGVEKAAKFLHRESAINSDIARMIGENLFYSSRRAVRELGYIITDWREAVRKTVEGLMT